MDGNGLADTPQAEKVCAHQEQTRKLGGAMMTLTGLSATGLARAAGLTPSTINSVMNRPVRHTLSQSTMLVLMTETFIRLKDKPIQSIDQIALADLAPAIAVYEHGMLEKSPEIAPIIIAAKSANQERRITNSLPGLGDISDLPVLIESSQGIDILSGGFSKAPLKTQRPPFLADDTKAFAILMPDERMMPRFDAGDMLYASPALNLAGSKVDVILDRKRGSFIIGSLASIDEDTILIDLLSPKSQECFDRSEVFGIYRIIGVQRLGR